MTSTHWNFADIFGTAFGVLFLIGLLALYLYSVLYSYRDAKARGKSGLLIALLVAFVAWPFGLLIWLLARPSETIGT